MKKLLLGAFILCGVVAQAKEIQPMAIKETEEVVAEKKVQYNIYPRVGVSFFSDYSMSGSTLDGTGIGYDVTVELTRNLTPNFEVGTGIGYQALADAENRLHHIEQDKYKNMECLPMYLTTKYTFPVVNDGIKPYVKADLGISFNGRADSKVGGQDVKNGVYWGVGAGVEQNNICVDIMVKGNTGEIEHDDFNNYRVVGSVSYRFDFLD